MNYKLLTMLVCAILFSLDAFAQVTVQGTVTDANTGELLPGVNVVIQELQTGSSTNIDGEYEIPNVPEGTYTLAVTYVGYQSYTNEIDVGNSTVTQNIELQQDIFGLEEIVVTGVGSGTETTKLGFSVSKVGEAELAEVPATDPGNALRAKIPGITVVQASGDPASSPDIRLRGSTSISGDQAPLIIVDGVITSGSLRDINMEDVESIEVVKGAAASSIYGSLAGNGVIQIITKRNAGKVDEPEITIRSEYGQSEIADDYPLATTHPYPNDYVLDETGQYIVEWPGFNNYDEDRRWDNEYPVLYDNVDALFTGQPYNTNYFSLANSSENVNYLVSFENMTQGGVLEPVDDYKRNTFRVNADFIPNDDFTASFSGSYINVETPDFEDEEQGQGDNYFYSVLTSEPFLDMTERSEDGSFSNNPTGYAVQSSNWQNPLYVAQNRNYSFDRDRIIAGLNLKYDLADWISVNARQSLDKSYLQREQYFPVGYQTPTPDATVNDGYEWRRATQNSTAVSEFWFEATQAYEDFNVRAIAKYLYENRSYEWFEAEGSEYVTQGIRDIGSLANDTYGIDSYQEDIRAENFFLNLDVDYQDKIIASGLIRRDGSSLFGSEERWQTYFRGSLAYRITEDFDLPNINEWKVRASYGTSGNRPPFEAQYETYSATSTGISPDVLGNNEIKPSTVAEIEFGTNIAFLNRFNFEANYALTNVTDDYLDVPLSSVAGFTTQWQNIGEIESSSLEFALSGQIINNRDMSLALNLSWDTYSQEITDLGDVPPYTRDLAAAALPLFRVEEGESYGAMYGNKVLTSVNDLTVVDGEVINPGGMDVNGDGSITANDFEVNQHGYVIPAGTHGTPDEQVIYQADESGEPSSTKIGDTVPDFKTGISANFRYKGFGVYALLDMVSGGDVYNYTKQLLYFNARHADFEKFAEQGFDPTYNDASSAIYNLSNASSYFVEDASYVKLREVAVSYTFGPEILGSLAGTIDEIKVSVTGRNLLTFTDYTGWDPEVALRTNATNFRLDEYAYPNYRTFSGTVQVRF